MHDIQTITNQSNMWYTIHKCCQDNYLTFNGNLQRGLAEQMVRKEKRACF